MVAELVHPPPDAVACLHALDHVLDSMRLDAYADLDVRTQAVVVKRIRQAKARLSAHELAAVRELDTSRGDRGRTGEAVANAFGRDQAEGRRTVRTAQAMADAPHTEAALAAGELAQPQAAVIASAIAGLEDTVTPAQRQACEEALIEAAADENEALQARERRARERTEMWLHVPLLAELVGGAPRR